MKLDFSLTICIPLLRVGQYVSRPPALNTIASLTVLIPQVDMLPGLGLWLVKRADGMLSRDQRRYFTLAYALRPRALRLVYYADLTDGAPTGRKGAIELSSTTTYKIVDAVLLVVRLCCVSLSVCPMQSGMVLFDWVA